MSNKEQVFHGQVSLHNNRFLSLTKDFCFIFFFLPDENAITKTIE